MARGGRVKEITKVIGILLLVNSGLARDLPVKSLHHSQTRELCRMFNPIPLYTLHLVYGSSTLTTDTHNNFNMRIFCAEFFGATIGAVVVSIPTFYVAHCILNSKGDTSDNATSRTRVLGATYIVGFPLGSALGTYFTGRYSHQKGTFWGSLVGGTIGMTIGIGVLAPAGEPGLILTLSLPQIGAVIGYNLFRKHSHSIEKQGYMFDVPQFEICAVGGFPYNQNLKIKMTLLKMKF